MAGRTVIESFLAVRESRGSARAVVSAGGLSASYEELGARADAFAQAFLERGAVRGDVVALKLPKSLELVAAMLGAWRAGIAFAPLSGPPQRIARIVSSLRPRWSVGEERLLDVEQIDPGAINEGVSLVPRASLSDLAYVIHTSGSSGAPKGVRVSHRGLWNVIGAQIETFAIDEHSRCLWFLSPSFDASLSDILTALLAGAELHIEPSLERERSTAALLGVLRERAITHVDLPPSLLALLRPEDLPDSLQTIIIGGEVCPPDVVRSFAERVRLVNVYGPTEATICTSMVRCDPSWTQPLIGAPVPGVRYEVLDPSRRRAAPGQTGELYIGGENLALGYVAAPELDEERFIELDGARMFRTLDRVRAGEDGAIEFIGRIDRQLKINGQLVAPEEIEAELLRQPDVGASRVVPMARAGGRTMLIAFVELKDAALSVERLAQSLSLALPSWMVPARIEVVDRLPRNAHDKIDDQALLELLLPVPGGSRAPSTALEAEIAELFRAVLGAGEPGLDESFASLGGDSIASLAAVAEASRRGLRLSASDFVEPLSVRQLAVRAEQRAGYSQAVAFEAIDSRELELLAPRSPRNVPVPPIDREPSVILLTGASGFLGRAVLAELLAETSARVLCVARRPIALPERCERVEGDLSLPDLGLSARDRRRIAEEVGSIVHLAASVNLARSCRELFATNVAATLALFDLALEGRAKSVHYASTLSVFVATDRGDAVFYEDDTLEAAVRIFGGYGQTKWLAERCLEKERRSGFDPLSIYRFGLLTGDSRTGTGSATDFLSTFLEGVARLGMLPDALELELDATPIDYAAKAMVRLMRAPPATYHLANPQPASLETIAEGMRLAGREPRIVSLDAWRESTARTLDPYEAAAHLGLCRAWSPVLERHRTLDLFQATRVRFDQRHTRAALAGTGIECPPATPELFARYVRALSLPAR